MDKKRLDRFIWNEDDIVIEKSKKEVDKEKEEKKVEKTPIVKPPSK